MSTRIMEGMNLRYIVSTFVNVMMYPQYNNEMIVIIIKENYWRIVKLFKRKKRQHYQEIRII
jgi:hypothetical protein